MMMGKKEKHLLPVYQVSSTEMNNLYMLFF